MELLVSTRPNFTTNTSCERIKPVQHPAWVRDAHPSYLGRSVQQYSESASKSFVEISREAAPPQEAGFLYRLSAIGTKLLYCSTSPIADSSQTPSILATRIESITSCFKGSRKHYTSTSGHESRINELSLSLCQSRRCPFNALNI